MDTQTKPKITKGRPVLVEFPDTLLMQTDRQAQSEMLSRSALIRRIVRDYVTKQGGANNERQAA